MRQSKISKHYLLCYTAVKTYNHICYKITKTSVTSFRSSKYSYKRVGNICRMSHYYHF